MMAENVATGMRFLRFPVVGNKPRGLWRICIKVASMHAWPLDHRITACRVLDLNGS